MSIAELKSTERESSATKGRGMVSVVVPIFNEEENLTELHRRLVATLESTGRTWEIIFVDDGSTDGSVAMIHQYNSVDDRIRMVGLSRNFGHQPALTAGIHHAIGDHVVLIDGDLQDPPELILAMLEKASEGYSVVLAERRSRAERGLKRLGFAVFYRVMRWLTDLPTFSNAGIFAVMDRSVVDEFNRLPERNRFIPGLRSWIGFRQTSILYDRQERAAGNAKQTVRRLIRYSLDGILSFSYQPLRVVTYTGLLVALTGFLLALMYILDFYLRNKPITGFTTIIVTVLFMGGVQLVSIGILGEYIGRIYEEVKQRPLYVVGQLLGLEPRSSRQKAKEPKDGHDPQN